MTGFQSYGGRSTNPSEAVVSALNGKTIGGERVCGHTLPVDFHAVRQLIPELINDTAPRVILSLGLWPGEPMIRIERVASNWSWFELPDNVGHRQNGTVIEDGPDAYMSTLPNDAMQSAIRAAGLPCRQSGSAGSYLCNAAFYIMRHHCAHHQPATAAGFIHLPYLPEQVAHLLDQSAHDGLLEMHQRADYASMSLEAMVHAVTIGLETKIGRASCRERV